MTLQANKGGTFVTVHEVREADFSLVNKKQMTIKTYTFGEIPNSISTVNTSTSSSTPTTATSSESDRWEDACGESEPPATARCPFTQEFQTAKSQCPILASTGCTKEFRQAGRAVHTDEPRVARIEQWKW